MTRASPALGHGSQWELSEANRKKKIYNDKYHPDKIHIDYTVDHFFSPTVLESTRQALRRWYNYSFQNQDGTDRYDQQNLYYTVMRTYMEIGDIERLSIACDTICYCDRDSVWDKFILEEGIRNSLKHPDVFRWCLYKVLCRNYSHNGPEELTVQWPQGFDDELNMICSFCEITKNSNMVTLHPMTRSAWSWAI